MNTWAAPGVQCVCIKDDWGHVQLGACSIPTRVPMLNEVLTVKRVEVFHGELSLMFEEIEEHQVSTDGIMSLGGDIWFHAYCFRPLEKRKTDISIFRKLLTPAGRIPVDA
ncbi:hypothetical protein G6L30_17205 [Agrobacterium rhizogenes]|nr:hypothetical protein [Rhizobium rhizogenes]